MNYTHYTCTVISPSSFYIIIIYFLYCFQWYENKLFKSCSTIRNINETETGNNYWGTVVKDSKNTNWCQSNNNNLPRLNMSKNSKATKIQLEPICCSLAIQMFHNKLWKSNKLHPKFAKLIRLLPSPPFPLYENFSKSLSLLYLHHPPDIIISRYNLILHSINSMIIYVYYIIYVHIYSKVIFFIKSIISN